MRNMIDQILNQQALKKTFKLLLSVSILFFSSTFSYFFLSQVSTIFQLYFQYHNLFDRSYMFLVCNGILVFLGLVGSSSFKNSSSTDAGEVSNINGFYSMNVVEKEPYVQSVGNLDNVSLEEEDGEVGKESMIVEESAKEEQNGLFIRDEEEELNEKLDYFTDEVEEGNRLSTVELNKKFDDFIRRMKEEIRIEAQQRTFNDGSMISS